MATKSENPVAAIVEASKTIAKVKAAAAKNGKAKKAVKEVKTRATPITEGDRRIKLLVKENPRREGTDCFKKFALYKSGMRCSEYLEAGKKLGVKSGSIATDVKRGYIELK